MLGLLCVWTLAICGQVGAQADVDAPVFDPAAVPEPKLGENGYEKIEDKNHEMTMSALFYKTGNSALSGKVLSVRTAYGDYGGGSEGADRVAQGNGIGARGKVVQRIRVTISERCLGTNCNAETGEIIGNLQFMGGQLTDHEGNFWWRYKMWKDAWTKAKESAEPGS